MAKSIQKSFHSSRSNPYSRQEPIILEYFLINSNKKTEYFQNIQDQIFYGIFSWANEDDPDDFVEKINNIKIDDITTSLIRKAINYKIANYFFRLFISKNVEISVPFFLKDFIRYIDDNDIEIKHDDSTFDEVDEKGNIIRKIEYVEKDKNQKLIFLKHSLKLILSATINLINLYDTILISLKKYFQQTRQIPPEYIYLYRGFAYNNEITDLFKHDDIGKNITIYSLLSTSLDEKIAHRFANKFNGIVWKIKINKKNYNKFKYSFVSRTSHDDDIININEIFLNENQTELEFLLNFGIILKLTEIENKGNLTYYHFDFIDYETDDDKTKIHEFNNYITDFIEKNVNQDFFDLNKMDN